MYRLTDIEPTRLRKPFEEVSMVPAGRCARSAFKVPSLRERFLVAADSDLTETQSLDFIHRFVGRNAEVCLMRSTAADPAGEVSRLATALGVNWVCLVAQWGSELMSLFLTKGAEKILRTSPCPVICIPESYAPAGNEPGSSGDVKPVRRILVPIRPSPNSRWTVEEAVGLAERFGAKLDLLGVEEFVRNPDGSRVVSRRSARRQQARVMRDELVHLTTSVIPNRLRGRRSVSLGLPLFYAALRSARELNSDLIVMSIPNGLWSARERIDVATERILHRAPCPVICLTAPVQSPTVVADQDSSRISKHQRRRREPAPRCQSRTNRLNRFPSGRTSETEGQTVLLNINAN